jgi:hypothetical protein
VQYIPRDRANQILDYHREIGPLQLWGLFIASALSSTNAETGAISDELRIDVDVYLRLSTMESASTFLFVAHPKMD